MRQITAMSLSALMLLSSIGFSIDMHFCQGMLKSYSLIGKAKTCHSTATAEMNCPHHQTMIADDHASDLDKKDCCTNKTLHFQNDQIQKGQSTDFAFQYQVPVTVPGTEVLWDILPWENTKSPLPRYKPPLIVKDRIVFAQSFLL
jgi:hypothetical protein